MSLAQFLSFFFFFFERTFKQENFNLEKQDSKCTPDDQKNVASQSRIDFLMQNYLNEESMSSSHNILTKKK